MNRRTFLAAAALTGVGLALPTTARAATKRPLDLVYVHSDSMGQVWPDYLSASLGVPVDTRYVIGGQRITDIEATFNGRHGENVGHIVWGGHVDCNERNMASALVAPAYLRMAALCNAGKFLGISLTNEESTAKGTPGYLTIISGPDSVNGKIATGLGQFYADVHEGLVTQGIGYMQSIGVQPTDEDYHDVQDLDIPPDTIRVDACLPGFKLPTCGNPGHIETKYKPFVSDLVYQQVGPTGLNWGAQ